MDLKSGELLSEAIDPKVSNGVDKVVIVKLGKFKSVDGEGNGGEGIHPSSLFLELCKMNIHIYITSLIS